MYKCTLLSNETANYFVYPICWCKSDAALKKKKKIRTEDLNSVFFYDKIFDILLKLLEELGIQFLSTCILT